MPSPRGGSLEVNLVPVEEGNHAAQRLHRHHLAVGQLGRAAGADWRAAPVVLLAELEAATSLRSDGRRRT